MKRLLVVLVAVAALAGCGILNSIFGDLDVTQQQLSDACHQIQTKCGAGGEGEGEGEGSSNDFTCDQLATCMSDKGGRNGCVDRYDDAVKCVLQGSSIQCVNKPCEQQLTAWAQCSLQNASSGSVSKSGGSATTGTTGTTPPQGNPLGDLCNGNGNCTGPVCNGVCCPAGTGGCDAQGNCATSGPCSLGSPCAAGSTCNSAGQCFPDTCLQSPSCTQCQTSTDPSCCSTCGSCGPCTGQSSNTCAVGDAPCCPACQTCGSTPNCSDPHFIGCPGCACNSNGICETGEQPNCSDCASLPSCSLDLNCSATETYACGDCLEGPNAPFPTKTCTSNADCASVLSSSCPPNFNGIACAANDNENCRTDEPTRQICWRGCSKTSDCPLDPARGFMCFPGFVQQDVGSCQPGTCHVGGTGECDVGNPCVDAMTLSTDNNSGTGRDAVCVKQCNASACAQGFASCECTGPTTRCAPMHAAGVVAEYVCVPPGQGIDNAPCVVETDCAVNKVCVGGHCAPMVPCSDSTQCGGPTPNCGPQGVCQP